MERGRYGPGNVGGERESSLLQLSRKDAARTHLCLWDDLMLLFHGSVLWTMRFGCPMGAYELWFGKGYEKAPVASPRQSLWNFMLISLAIMKT